MEFEIKRIHSTAFMKHSVERTDNVPQSPNLRDIHIECNVLHSTARETKYNFWTQTPFSFSHSPLSFTTYICPWLTKYASHVCHQRVC